MGVKQIAKWSRIDQMDRVEDDAFATEVPALPIWSR